MSNRQRLPNRRANQSFDFDCADVAYTATVSRFEDGRIGEIFLTSSKVGSTADTAARDSAIAFSFAMQFGADIDVVRRALCRDVAGRPSGPLGVALDVLEGV